jgi:hypothetical protein
MPDGVCNPVRNVSRTEKNVMDGIANPGGILKFYYAGRGLQPRP